MVDYFSFYDIPVTFNVDESQLKKIFYSNSKKYHPDYYSLEDQDAKEKALEMSTLNNKAYKTLKDFDLRMKYILDLHSILEDEGQNKLPQDFLMEMMELNESIMELQMDFDSDQQKIINKKITGFENELLNSIEIDIQTFKGQANYDFSQVKNYYFKKKYLRRLKDHLNGISAEI